MIQVLHVFHLLSRFSSEALFLNLTWGYIIQWGLNVTIQHSTGWEKIEVYRWSSTCICDIWKFSIKRDLSLVLISRHLNIPLLMSFSSLPVLLWRLLIKLTSNISLNMWYVGFWAPSHYEVTPTTESYLVIFRRPIILLLQD